MNYPQLTLTFPVHLLHEFQQKNRNFYHKNLTVKLPLQTAFLHSLKNAVDEPV